MSTNPLAGITPMQYVHQQIQRIFMEIAEHAGGDGENGIAPILLFSAEMTLHHAWQDWSKENIGDGVELGDWPGAPGYKSPKGEPTCPKP